MAGKTYELLFQLSAQLNGAFSASLQRAQTEFTKLDREISRLNQTQKDVSAYQKQTQKVEELKNQLEGYKTELTNVSNENVKSGKSIDQLVKEKEKLTKEIEKTETKLKAEEEALKQAGEKLKAAGVDTAKLSEEEARLTRELEACKKAQDDAAKSAESLGTNAAKQIEAFAQSAGAAVASAAFEKISGAIRECIDTAAQFESAMSNVEAISGANAREIEELSDLAKELGATTKFTAKESADALGYMAMAGWDTEQMLSGMSGVLNLAAASGEDLGTVADIVTDAMTAFGMSADQSQEFADVLAATAASANTNVGLMGETFKYAAPVAGALGYTIKDVSVAIGLMANSGIKASNAGTALRNVFNGLLTGVTLTGKAIGDVTVSAVNESGEMKEFGKTIDELRGYFEQMTEAEKVQNAVNIAGQRGYAGLLAILNASEDDFEKLRGNIDSCTGAAERMAEIKMDNLEGDITLLNSALDGVKTSIGEEFIPVAREAAQAGADILSGLNTWIQRNPDMIKMLAEFAMGVTGSISAVMGLSAAIKSFNSIRALMGTELFSIGGLAVSGGMVAGLGAVAAAAFVVAQAYDESIDSAWELTEATRAAEGAMRDARYGFEDSAKESFATADVADIYIGRLETMEKILGDDASKTQEYRDTLMLLEDTIPGISELIDEETLKIDGGTQALREYTEEWQANYIAQAKMDYIKSIYDAYNETLINQRENQIELARIQDEINEKQTEYAENLDKINSLDPGDPERSRLQAQNQVLYEEVLHLKNQQGELEDAVKRGSDAVKKAEDEMQHAQERADQIYEGFGETTQNMVEEEAKAVEEMDMSAEAGAAIGSTMQGAITETDRKTPQLAAAAIRAGRAWMAAFGEATSGTPTMNMPSPGGGSLPNPKFAAADGIDYAPRGVGLVGEEGPELVRFRGGEEVIPADRTADILRGGSPVNVSVAFNVSGADAATVGQLEQYGETFAERVRAAVAEAMEDSRRRAYA